MTYRPLIIDTPAPAPYVGEVDRDTSEAQAIVGRLGSRPTGLAAPSSFGYNPTTREFAYGGDVIGTMGINDLEKVLPTVQGKQAATPLPEGFEPVNVTRFTSVLRQARENPTSDLSSFFPNAAQAAGGIASAVGAAVGANDFQNPWADAASNALLEQSWDQQASHDASPFTSIAGLGTNLATGLGQVAPTVAAGLLTGGTGAVVTGALSAAGQQGDAGMQALQEAIGDMSEQELADSSPVYEALRHGGKSHAEAVDSMLAAARGRGAIVGAVEGSLETILGTKLLGGIWSKFASKVPGLGAFSPLKSESLVKRVLTASAAGGIGEGIGAAAGDFVVNERARDIAGLDSNYDAGDAWQSFEQEAPLGFVAGALGGIRGRSKVTAPDKSGEVNTLVNGTTPPAPPSNPTAGSDLAMVGKERNGQAADSGPQMNLFDEVGEPVNVGPIQGQLDLGPLPQGASTAVPMRNEGLPPAPPTQRDMFDPVTGVQGELDFQPPPVPVQPVAPTPQAIPLRNEGPLPAPTAQRDMFDPATGEPVNVGPAQGQFDLGPTPQAPVAPGVQQSLPLTPQEGPAPQQDDAFGLPKESPAVAKVFNQFLQDVIRPAEEQMGLGVDAVEESAPAEAMSVEQAISSLMSAAKRKIITFAQFNEAKNAINEAAAQEEAAPPQRLAGPMPDAGAQGALLDENGMPVSSVPETAPEQATAPEANPAPQPSVPLADTGEQASFDFNMAPPEAPPVATAGAKGRAVKAAAQQGATISEVVPTAPTPEPQLDLQTQLARVLDGSKPAMLVTQNDSGAKSIIARAKKAKAHIIDTVRGTVITMNKNLAAKVAKIKDAAISDAQMARVLSYTDTKSETDGTAVVQKAPNGAVVKSELTNKDKVNAIVEAVKKAASKKQSSKNDTVEVTTAPAEQTRRKVEIAKETTQKRAAPAPKPEAKPAPKAPPKAAPKTSVPTIKALRAQFIGRVSGLAKKGVTTEDIRSAAMRLEGLDEVSKNENIAESPGVNGILDVLERESNSLAEFNRFITNLEEMAIQEAATRAEGKKGVGKPQSSTATKSVAEPTPQTTSTPSGKSGTTKPKASRQVLSPKVAATITKLQAAVDKLTKGNRNPPKITIHETSSTLPQSIKDGLLDWEDVEGVYDPASGEIHLVAENIESGTEAVVLAHELIGHYGVENIIGKGEWDVIMADIRRLRKNPKFADFFARLDARYTGEDESTMAKEVLAVLAERKQSASILNKVARAIQRGLRRLGLEIGTQDILDHLPESIHGTLGQAEAFVAFGKGTPQIGSPLASRAGRVMDSAKAAAKTAGKSATVDSIKSAAMKFWNTRDLQEFYGDVSTRWGRAYKRLIDIAAEKHATAQRQIQAVSHVMARLQALPKDQIQKVQELMLKTQEYGEVNPSLTFEQNKWLSKSDNMIELSRKRYDEARAMYDKLSPEAQKVLVDLATANAALHTDLLKSKVANYNKLKGISVEDGGLPKDVTDGIVKSLEEEVDDLKLGKMNFSMQRTGDWLVSVPSVETESSRHATEAEAKATATAATQTSAYLKPTVKKVGDEYVVYVSEPQLFTYDSEAEAEAALPDIEAGLKEHFTAHFKKLYPDDAARAKQEAADAFDDVWFGSPVDETDQNSERVPNVMPMKRTKLYDKQIEKMFSPELLAKLNALKGRGLTESAYTQLLHDYMAMTERSAFRKSQLNRRLIRGADANDMIAAYIRRYTSTAQALAESLHSIATSEALAELNDRESQREFKFKTGKSPERGLNQYLSSQTAVTSMMRDTASNRFWTNVRAVVTFLNLGFSPAFLALNLSQPYVVTIPYLASKTINGKTISHAEAAEYVAKAAGGKDRLASIFNAVKDGVMSDLQSLTNNKKETKEQWSEKTIKEMMDLWAKDLKHGSSKEFIEQLKELDKQDALTLSYTNDLYDAMDMGTLTDKTQRVLRISMAGAKLSEVINRFTTARAAYELGTKYGLKGDALTDFINKTLYKTQGDFSRNNRAEAFNHPVWGTALQFRNYVQMMYSLFIGAAHGALRGQTPAQRKEGRRLLGGLLATHFAAGGLSGLGYVGSAAKLAAVMVGFGAAGDDEEHYLTNDMDLDTQFRKGMRELLDDPRGESALATALGYGLPAMLGVDVSERVQIPRLVDTRYIRVDPTNDTPSWMNGFAAQTIGGAPWSTATRIVDGATGMFEAGKEGDLQKLRNEFAKLLPQAPANFIKAYEYANRGAIDSSGRDIGSGELGAGAVLTRFLGFNPTSVSEAQRKRSEYFDVKGDTEARRSELLKNWRRTTGGDKVRAMKAIQEFNNTHPKAVHITAETLRTSAKSGSKAMDTKVDKAYRDQLFIQK